MSEKRTPDQAGLQPMEHVEQNMNQEPQQMVMETQKTPHIPQVKEVKQKAPKISAYERKKTKLLKTHDIDSLENIANIMRLKAVQMTTKAGSGHPTSASSCADFVAALFFDINGMHYDPQKPDHYLNDRLILSKGHAAPILYAAWNQAGFLSDEVLQTLRTIDSHLDGHPVPYWPFVDVATGSLGQGLGVACGQAYSSKYFDKLDNRFFVVLGDGEIAEGSIWEAAQFAWIYGLDNIIAFVDVNSYGQSNELGYYMETYKKRFESFGWQAQVIDGHNMCEIVEALDQARNKTGGYPQVIIGKTKKGKNFGDKVEGVMGFHGKSLGDESNGAIKHLEGLITNKNAKIVPKLPVGYQSAPADGGLKVGDFHFSSTPTYTKGEKLATRGGYGSALIRLGYNKSLVVLDADLKNSTFSEQFMLKFPDNFVECYICEQNMVSVATGLATRSKVPFCSTFACFLTRAFDQIRMASISGANVKFCGSHAGCSIGEDGTSQMGLEDISMFRSINGSVVLYPSDPVATEYSVLLAANTKGIAYIRTGRQPTPIIYDNNEKFEVGKCKVVRHRQNDQIVVVAAGVTLFEAIHAADQLALGGIGVRVIDIFSVKPIDTEALEKAGNECGKNILTVEDHYQQGGIFEAVAAALSTSGIKVHCLAVSRMPKSGKAQELYEYVGISSKCIQAKIKQILHHTH